MLDIGVIHGRFQVLHNDHLKYLMAGKERCRHLVVGITNPDPTQTREDAADLKRSSPAANPLNYFERYIMVRDAISQEGISLVDFSVVPFPINMPELYKYYVPIDSTFFLTIYDQWGRRKLELFESLGLKTEILWERPLHKKGLSGADIRKRMVVEEPWEALVPPSTRLLMKKWGIPERLRKVQQQSSS
ncbi:MAG: nicotinate-nucleotide adenylyltransferase [Deltaproteobacteria bacterium]|nr:MAG: nicotinate-nucleotide adenylyltransferase [Deltaproteobacteria bacterium]